MGLVVADFNRRKTSLCNRTGRGKELMLQSCPASRAHHRGVLTLPPCPSVSVSYLDQRCHRGRETLEE
jgi:hypothetical protein